MLFQCKKIKKNKKENKRVLFKELNNKKCYWEKKMSAVKGNKK